MRYPRELAKELARYKKSLLLLGPRQTGKSTLLAAQKADVAINLADEETFRDHARDPALLKNLLTNSSARSVLIDEVQRLPSILNTIQALMDNHPKIRFLLTGSSARKLRRGHANLLPGRLLSYSLGGLSASELADAFDLRKCLTTGTLPGIYSEADAGLRKKLLRSYASTYLREEIQAEALTKDIEGFSRFFDVAAAYSGQFVDFTKISSLSGINRQTAARYFDILCDTLVVYALKPFAKSPSVRLSQHPKMYFFDCGVWNGILGNFELSLDRIGPLFEHWVLQEIIHTAYARDMELSVTTYRTQAGAEVDFIVEREGKLFAVEVKASRNVGRSDCRGFASLRALLGKRKFTPLIVYLGSREFELEGAKVLPPQSLSKALFA